MWILKRLVSLMSYKKFEKTEDPVAASSDKGALSFISDTGSITTAPVTNQPSMRDWSSYGVQPLKIPLIPPSRLVLEILSKATAAHIMTCTRALMESDGDLHAALNWLRTKSYIIDEEKLRGIANVLAATSVTASYYHSAYPQTAQYTEISNLIHVRAHTRRTPQRKP